MRENYIEAEDKRHFRFYYDDQQGKSVTMNVSTSDGANGIVKEFEKFMKACGYIADGHLTIQRPILTEAGQKKLAPREGVIAQAAKEERVAKPSFDFNNIPNNSWLFSSQQIPSITTADLAAFKPIDLSSITVTDLTTGETKQMSEFSSINQFPTMAPITSEQIQSWNFNMPGTLGGAKVKF